MRHIYLLLFFSVLGLSASAQNDTLLWEDFEAETIDYIVNDYPTGDPNLYPTFLNFDVDGIPDGSGADRPDEWFLSFGFADVDSANTVLASNSWLQGEVDGAENWLITPRIHIQDGQAMLYWKSAPFQLPRYMDGYQVLVSRLTNVETDFLDTLAVFSEFDGHLTTDYDDTSTYVFTPGIMHTELEYDSADVTRHTGVLQQWSASLAQFEGENIFIAFRHRSDDDNLISIDDILVLGTGSVGIDNPKEQPLGLSIYPNPVSAGEKVLLNYQLNGLSTVRFSVRSLEGRLLSSSGGHTQMAGAHILGLSTYGLAPGTYLVTLDVNRQEHTERLVVE